MPAKPRQYGGLVACTGTAFEYAVMLSQLQLLRHVGDYERLADGLPAINAERTIPVGVTAIGRLDERLARDLLHGAQHRLIADTAPPQGKLKHHLFRRILNRGHVDPSKSCCPRGSLQLDAKCLSAEKRFLTNRGSSPGTRVDT